ncbi:iron transporter [Streptomyces actinomycinicus]|uniref:Iron transporter n=1 Tax=Streptomyces actinomycinicus TaxID=1695166 RepID=A0A937EKZ8_9ACTN|nr:IucA/IucC family protein [Streptomyces actinomycinicus]MBL1085132.1 iron transporter [Streptomyces actinomycinicus]
MNATPSPDGSSGVPDEPGGSGAPPSRVPLTESVPQQKRRDADLTRRTEPGADPLEDPDPHTAGQAAAVENLLRCWVRENGLAAPTTGSLRIPMPASGTALVAPVRYWSPTGWHRFGPPRFPHAPESAPTVDAVTLAALLGRESAGTSGPADGTTAPGATATGPGLDLGSSADPGLGSGPGPVPGPTHSSRPGPGLVPGPDIGPRLDTGTGGGRPGTGDGGDLVARVADSARRTATFIRHRRGHPTDHPDLFLSAEQALLLGHPLHPTPKSREGLTETEADRYSPELRGSFPLHWLAVAPSLLATDSAWTERGRPVAAADLARRLAGTALPLPDGYTALPLHPWQAREVRHRVCVAALFDSGLLSDLGPLGAPWHPTSSVRTVHQPGAPAMLKLSLGLRITNSRRENLRKELHRGVEVHRLLRTGLAKQWQAAHPGFDIVRDPAWLAVDDPDGLAVPGLEVMIRHNPFGPADDVGCVAGLVSPRPVTGPTPNPASPPAAWPLRSRLAQLVERLAARTGRPVGAVATEWFLRYLEHVVRPVLWLDAEAGIALEAHQQNTLLLLDREGWPAGGRYRDNQGYYFRESRRSDLDARLPGIGEHSDTFVTDEVTDERFAYYLAINNVLGLIGAFGSQRLADERLLLAAFRRFLADLASGPAPLRTSLPGLLLDSPVLRCKANLLTRLHGLDELVGPVDTQSVYVTIANPLHS